MHIVHRNIFIYDFCTIHSFQFTLLFFFMHNCSYLAAFLCMIDKEFCSFYYLLLQIIMSKEMKPIKSSVLSNVEFYLYSAYFWGRSRR